MTPTDVVINAAAINAGGKAIVQHVLAGNHNTVKNLLQTNYCVPHVRTLRAVIALVSRLGPSKDVQILIRRWGLFEVAELLGLDFISMRKYAKPFGYGDLLVCSPNRGNATVCNFRSARGEMCVVEWLYPHGTTMVSLVHKNMLRRHTQPGRLIDDHERVIARPSKAELKDQCFNLKEVICSFLAPRLEYMSTHCGIPSTFITPIPDGVTVEDHYKECEARWFAQLRELSEWARAHANNYKYCDKGDEENDEKMMRKFAKVFPALWT